MRLLTDTNIFIDYWKRPTEGLRTIFRESDIVVCGVVRAELLHGAVSEKNFREMTIMLDAFDEINPTEDSWQCLGDFLYRMRRHGITAPFTDAMISTIAVENDLSVWTNDKHFTMIQSVIPQLKIARTGNLV